MGGLLLVALCFPSVQAAFDVTAPSICHGLAPNSSRAATTITIAGPSSLLASSSYYAYGVSMRQAAFLFADWLNLERGGVNLGGKRHYLKFVFIDDASTSTQTTDATLAACSEDGAAADFIFGGYSTGTSIYAAQAAYSQSKLMLSAGAGSGIVFQQNNLTFGARPPAGPPSHAQHALCSAQHPLPSPRWQAWCR